MHHDGIRFGALEMFPLQTVELKVLVLGEVQDVLPLELHAEHHDDVGVRDRFDDVVGQQNSGR